MEELYQRFYLLPQREDFHMIQKKKKAKLGIMDIVH
jgi:hypothetical protein